jgi:hypothetical protein
VRSSTRDTLPAQVPAGQVASEAPAAGNARPTALTAGLAALAQLTAEIVTVILLGECGVPPADAATGLAAARRRRAGGS